MVEEQGPKRGHKAILVSLDGGEASRAVLEAAYGVAMRSGGHLDVFHAQPDSKEAVPLLGEGMSGAMIEEMMEMADRDAAERTSSARKIYDEFIAEKGVRVQDTGPAGDEMTIAWMSETGREDELIARRGRVHDLIVMGRPATEAERPSLMTVHAAIFETGRPVLVIPADAPHDIGSRVAIAWNGSAEASRAVGGAIPFLRNADAVFCFSVETEKSAGRLGPAELARQLSWHGINAKEQVISPAGQSVGHAILSQCEKDDINLLVMGAYTHSRVIQIILGGVTREVLGGAKIPVLLAH